MNKRFILDEMKGLEEKIKKAREEGNEGTYRNLLRNYGELASIAGRIKEDNPHLKYKPVLSRDGNMWCAMYGENPMEGVCGFGETPEKAMEEFDKEWEKVLEIGYITPSITSEAKEITITTYKDSVSVDDIEEKQKEWSESKRYYQLEELKNAIIKKELIDYGLNADQNRGFGKSNFIAKVAKELSIIVVVNNVGTRSLSRTFEERLKRTDDFYNKEGYICLTIEEALNISRGHKFSGEEIILDDAYLTRENLSTLKQIFREVYGIVHITD